MEHKNWEERFDEEFVCLTGDHLAHYGRECVTANEVKSFIRQVAAEERQATGEYILGLLGEYGGSTFEETREEIRQYLRTPKKGEDVG